MSTPLSGTKLSQNPHYGRPSARKLRERVRGWTLSRTGFQLLREIHTTIDAARPKVSREFDDLVA